MEGSSSKLRSLRVVPLHRFEQKDQMVNSQLWGKGKGPQVRGFSASFVEMVSNDHGRVSEALWIQMGREEITILWQGFKGAL